MFRAQNSVPSVYVDESRDFQLLGRILDCLQGGIKYDIDEMTHLLEPLKTKDTVLAYLCSRVGFYPRIDIDANVLIYIIAAFQYAVKYKGSSRGIEYAVNAVLKAENDPRSVNNAIITIINDPDYTISIITNNKIYNKAALKEFLRYIIPFGYIYTITEGTLYGSESDISNTVAIDSDDSNNVAVLYGYNGVVGITGKIDTTVGSTDVEASGFGTAYDPKNILGPTGSVDNVNIPDVFGEVATGPTGYVPVIIGGVNASYVMNAPTGSTT